MKSISLQNGIFITLLFISHVLYSCTRKINNPSNANGGQYNNIIQVTQPTPQAQNVPVQPIFAWQPYPDAVKYDIYWGTSTDNLQLNTYSANLIVPGDTIRNSIQFNYSTIYYWQVKAKDAHGVVLASSDINSFSIRDASNIPNPLSASPGVAINNLLYFISGLSVKGANPNTSSLFFNTNTGIWATLQTSINFTPLVYFATALVNDSIFVAGGNTNGVSSALFKVYNPHNNMWTVLNNATFIPRQSFVGIAMGNKLYFVGGNYQDGMGGNTDTNAVQIYNKHTSLWSTITPAQGFTAREGFVGFNYGGKLYFIGGKNKNGLVNTIEVYDTLTNTWSVANNQNFIARYGCSADIINNDIYVAGGITEGDTVSNVFQKYDVLNQKWFNLSNNLMKSRAYLSANIVNNNLYLIGGQDNQGNPMNVVQIYNIQNDQWQ
ncbi:MAG: kelch repeat-containing protein [Phycisphaerales bacterium]|nr:kelch repeat-containing protein [Phycisphaerales bacterium]